MAVDLSEPDVNELLRFLLMAEPLRRHFLFSKSSSSSRKQDLASVTMEHLKELRVDLPEFAIIWPLPRLIVTEPPWRHSTSQSPTLADLSVNDMISLIVFNFTFSF